ncbi:HTH_48 domain-containing protein [Trichonephila clavipes]|nr:HTH_48 domain-containing protein [Trichonephila clavipes]
MVTVYGEKCVSDKPVRKWSVRFRAGHESVGDDQRPGEANTVITSDLIDKVNDLVRSDRRVTLRMLVQKVDVSYGTVWTIVHDRLRFRKVRYLWNSSSTEEALTPMRTVRHPNAYAGPSRTKYRGCSWRVGFCSMITCVHTSPESQMELDTFQMGDVGPSTLQSGHVTLRFPCVWSTEETPEREALQLRRSTQGHCEGLCLVTAT